MKMINFTYFGSIDLPIFFWKGCKIIIPKRKIDSPFSTMEPLSKTPEIFESQPVEATSLLVNWKKTSTFLFVCFPATHKSSSKCLFESIREKYVETLIIFCYLPAYLARKFTGQLVQFQSFKQHQHSIPDEVPLFSNHFFWTDWHRVPSYGKTIKDSGTLVRGESQAFRSRAGLPQVHNITTRL